MSFIQNIAEIEAAVRPLLSYVAVALVVVLLLKNRVKKVSIGKLQIETAGDAKEPASITQHLEVRDFQHVLREGMTTVQEDIRTRVRQNGWLEITDFDSYVEDAIIQHELQLTKYMNEHYYFGAKIDADALYDINQIVAREVRAIYRQTYNKMFYIVGKTRGEIEEKKRILQRIEDRRECNPHTSKCNNVSDVIKLTTDICVTEHIQMKYLCLVEAERGINEIIQIYYSNYLIKYKEIYQKSA